MIFFDQFKVPKIKFGKCFEEFMIPIALLKVVSPVLLVVSHPVVSTIFD